MSIFNQLRKNQEKLSKRDRRDMDERETMCAEAIARILVEFQCGIVPVLRTDKKSIYADVSLEAIPPSEVDKMPTLKDLNLPEHAEDTAKEGTNKVA